MGLRFYIRLSQKAKCSATVAAQVRTALRWDRIKHLSYGVAEYGGNGRGLIFRLTADGKNFRELHSFPNVNHDNNSNNEGAVPNAAVEPLDVMGHYMELRILAANMGSA